MLLPQEIYLLANTFATVRRTTHASRSHSTNLKRKHQIESSSLRERGVEFELPKESNFRDIVPSLELSEESFKASLQVSTYGDTRSFSGYHRGKERGTGTRNYGIIVGLTSRTASFARLLADRARDMKSPNFDGVVPISHTELGRDMKANNVELVLRTLAGFIVHSNVAFSVLLDDGDGACSNVFTIL